MKKEARVSRKWRMMTQAMGFLGAILGSLFGGWLMVRDPASSSAGIVTTTVFMGLGGYLMGIALIELLRDVFNK